MCSEGFVDKYHLYNLWRAKPYIYRSNCVVLVEGAPDVWRLEEAGIHNAVALMGAEVTDIQRSRLECLAVTSIVVAVDMDEAGRRAADVIRQRCGYIANIFRLELPDGRKDVAEMGVDEVKGHVLPFVLSKSKNS